jgi:hypothetical protein
MLQTASIFTIYRLKGQLLFTYNFDLDVGFDFTVTFNNRFVDTNLFHICLTSDGDVSAIDFKAFSS